MVGSSLLHMSTRTRSKGNESAYVYMSGQIVGERFVRLTDDHEVVWESAPEFNNGFTTVEMTGFPYERMVDTPDRPLLDNNVTHVRREAFGGPNTHVWLTGPSFLYGSPAKIHRRRFKVWLPLADYCLKQDAHLGALSGLKALAIARVPAYTQATMDAFTSILEAREMCDLTALKAAAALARYGKTLYLASRGRGSIRRLLTRDGKRALERLRRIGRKLSSDDCKESWKQVLTGMAAVSSADMEWKYGYAPMIRDIQAANAAVASIGRLRQRLLDGVRVYGHATYVSTSTGVKTKYLTDGYARTGGIDPFVFSYTKVTRTSATASIVRSLNPSDPYLDVDWFTALDAVCAINGLKPSLSRIWAALPLSFVTDWFWNVGALLESVEGLKSPIGTSIVSSRGMYSEKSETTVTGSASFANAAEATSFGCGAKRTNYNRSTDPLTGGPAVYIPPITVPTKAGQWWSMAQIAFATAVSKVR